MSTHTTTNTPTADEDVEALMAVPGEPATLEELRDRIAVLTYRVETLSSRLESVLGAADAFLSKMPKLPGLPQMPKF